MVRCTKRRQRDDASLRQTYLCCRVNNGGCHCFFICKHRKNAADALREHRLSGTWWTDEQQMMCPRSSDLECLTCRRLTAHIFHVNNRRRSVDNCSDLCAGWCRYPCSLARKTFDQMRECLCTHDFITSSNSCFALTFICHHHNAVINCSNKRHDSSNGSKRAVQTKFGNERISLSNFVWQNILHDEQTNSDCYVEPGTTFAFVHTGGEVYSDAPIWPRQIT